MAIVESLEPHRSDRTHLVLRYAVASRILLLTLIVLWRSIVDPYDTSALLNPNCISFSNGSDSDPLVNGAVLWPWIGSKIEGSIVWDSVYFSRIAQCGYEYEQTYAFLPLFPICMRVLSRTVFRPLVLLIGLRAVLGVSGYLLNIAAFSFAAMYMYRLSLLILKDSEASLQAAVLFCFNPASIFYSSVYSESLYSLLSVGGVYHLLSGEKSVSIILLALSGSVRSNGILNAGYVCFETLHRTHDTILHRKSAFAAIKFLILGVLRSICILYHLLHSKLMDTTTSALEGNQMKSAHGAQLEYHCYTIISRVVTDNQHFRKRIIVQGSVTKATPVDYEVSMSSRYYPVFLIPFVLHLAFMVATAFFVMHVQVSTRFLSACPPLYWFASHIMTSTDTGSKRRASLIWTYSAGYIFLGSLLFSNFYPFT
ncbi:hypothetical protein QQ045_018555 [Rhodiola kirilowii]